MIYIVHGNDYAKSRLLVINQQKKLESGNKLELEISAITPKELLEAVSAIDLFGKPPFVVLKIKDSKTAGLDKFIDVIKKTPDNAILTILAEKELTKTNEIIKNASAFKAKVILNNVIPTSNIFRFIDCLFSKNRTAAYKELNKLITEEADLFYVFSMILYGLRNITNAKFQSEAFAKQKGFMKDKLEKQAAAFDAKNIPGLFGFFYDIDKKIKTGLIQQEVALTYAIEKIIES